MKTGNELISDERATHEAKGWTAAHDDAHKNGELALNAAQMIFGYEDRWGLTNKTFEEGGRIRQLVVAGALIAAEIDRLQRKKL